MFTLWIERNRENRREKKKEEEKKPKQTTPILFELGK